MKLGALLLTFALALLAGCGNRAAVPVPSVASKPLADSGPVAPAVKDGSGSDEEPCLPVPADEIVGNYQASWKGNLSCPGALPVAAFGDILMTVSRVPQPDAFVITGQMFALASSPKKLAGPLSGEMSCRSFRATVSLGATSSATLTATFDWVSQYVGWGFPAGSWSATGIGDGCQLAGTWAASRY